MQGERTAAKSPDASRKAASPFKSQEEPIMCPWLNFSEGGMRYRVECEQPEQFIEDEKTHQGIFVPEVCAACLQGKNIHALTIGKTGRDPIWERKHPMPGA